MKAAVKEVFEWEHSDKSCGVTIERWDYGDVVSPDVSVDVYVRGEMLTAYIPLSKAVEMAKAIIALSEEML